MRTAAMVVAGLLVGCASPGDDHLTAETGTKTTKPDWSGYVDPRFGGDLSAAVWNGMEMVLIAFVNHDDDPRQWSNVVAAYDPATGSWRDLPKLPTDVAVTTNSVEMSKLGVVVAGLRCDPGTWHQEDMGWYCDPAELRTFLQPIGEDGFVEIDPPADAQPDQGIPSLVQGTSESSPYLHYGDKLYRLTDDLTWELQDADPTRGLMCLVGDRILATSAGAPLATFDPESKAWTPIELPDQAGEGTLHCGDGSSALYAVRSGVPSTQTAFLLTVGKPPVQIEMPPALSPGSITFDGESFVTSGAMVKGLAPGESPDTLPTKLYLFDPATGQLQATSHPLQPGESVEAFPLDGSVALYDTSTSAGCPTGASDPCQPPQHRLKVQPVVKTAG